MEMIKTPKTLIDSGETIAFKSDVLTIIYYDPTFDKEGNFSGVTKSDIDNETNQFYLLVNDNAVSIVALENGNQFARLNATDPTVLRENNNEIFVDAIYYGLPHNKSKIKLEFNKQPAHTLVLSNPFAIITIVGDNEKLEPSIQSQYILQNIEYIGAVHTN